MDSELKSMLDRAGELLKELKDEYESSLSDQKVTNRAKVLTHEILEKLRHTLDHIMNRVWEKFLAPNLSKKDRKSALVYFPIGKNLHTMTLKLDQAKVRNLEKVNKPLYDFLLKKQPFSAKENKWLELLSKIAGKGKHFRLAPQKTHKVIHRKRYKPKGLFLISKDGDIPKIISDVQDTSKPVHPKTQTVLPAPDRAEIITTGTAFVFDDYEVDAFGFCNEAYTKTCALIEEMVKVFKI